MADNSQITIQGKVMQLIGSTYKIAGKSSIEVWVEGGIAYCSFGDNRNVDLELAKYCVEKRLSVFKGFSYPSHIDMRTIKTISKEARKYFADEGSRGIVAGALIVEFPFSEMLGNIFLTINKPKIPTKLFVNSENALNWLREF